MGNTDDDFFFSSSFILCPRQSFYIKASSIFNSLFWSEWLMIHAEFRFRVPIGLTNFFKQFLSQTNDFASCVLVSYVAIPHLLFSNIKCYVSLMVRFDALNYDSAVTQNSDGDIDIPNTGELFHNDNTRLHLL